MEYSKLYPQKPQFGAYVFALLFVFTGVFSLRGELLGKAFPARVPAEPEASAVVLKKKAVPVLSPEVIKANLAQPRRAVPLPPEIIDSETLWLARAIYSETKRPEEQELVAWVVRNRVETQYRDKNTYHDVVLDPFQFSAFNENNRKRAYYMQLGVHSKAPGWQRALSLAYSVRHADTTWRPFPVETRHFYSEQSMVGRAHPEWSEGLQPVTPHRPVKIETKRFRFYTGVW